MELKRPVKISVLPDVIQKMQSIPYCIHISFFLLLGLAHGIVISSFPVWENALSADSSFQARIVKPDLALFILAGGVGFVLFFLLYFLGKYCLQTLYSFDKPQLHAVTTIVLLPLVLPLLAGHLYVQSYRLYFLFFPPALFLSIIFLIEIDGLFPTHRRDIPFLSRVRRKGGIPSSIIVGLLFIVILLFLPFTPLISYEEPTGDEPNYLIIANSLVTDGDIDLHDDYDTGEYHRFYSSFLHHRVTVDTQKRWLPSQGIGLPLILAPFYWIGMHVGDVVWSSRFCMTVLSLLCLFFMYRTHRQESLDSRNYRNIWGMIGIAGVSPWLYYSHQIYPEVAAALLLSMSMSFSLQKNRTSAVLSGIFAGFLPWLGIKYIVPLAAMSSVWVLQLIVILVRKKVNEKEHLFRLVIQVVVMVIMVLLFFGMFYQLYGTFNFVKTHGIKGTDSAGFGTSLSWTVTHGIEHLPETLRIAFGYLLDQRVGILFYSPIFLVALIGMFLALRNRPWFHLSLLFYCLSHWALFAWTGQWEGYCLPVRYLVPLIPIFASWLGYVYERTCRIRLVWLLQLFSILMGIHILFHLNRFYHFVLWRNPDEHNHLLQAFSNKVIDFTASVPSFTHTNLQWGIIGFWAILFLLVGVLLYRLIYRESELQHLFSAGLYSLIVIGFILFFLVFLSMSGRSPDISFAFSKFSVDGSSIYSMTNDTYSPEEEGVWVRGAGCGRFLWQLSPELSQAKSFTITIHSLTENKVTILYLGKIVTMDIPQEHQVTFQFPLPPEHVTETGKEGDGFIDFYLRCSRGIRPSARSETLDRRLLGCFIRFNTHSSRFVQRHSGVQFP